MFLRSTGGGGLGSTEAPCLFYGLSLQLCNDCREVAQSSKANSRIGWGICLYRCIIVG